MSSTISRLSIVTLPIALGAAGVASAQEPASFDTRAIVEYLADDELEGRLTGSAGIRMAADYIVEQLEAIGAEPLPGVGGFRQAFSYTAGVTDTGTSLRIEGTDGTRMTVSSSGDAGATPPAAPTPPAPPAPGAGAVAPPAPPGAPSIRALSFSDTGRAEGESSSSPATVFRYPRRTTSATTATPRWTSRTRSSSCSATSPRIPRESCARPWRGTRVSATRRWRRASGARRD